VHQTQMPLEPAIARQTMTLIDKVEKLRAHFGMAKEQPVAAVVATALKRLELVGRLEGASVVAKADACMAALASMPAAAPVQVYEMQVHEVQPVLMMASPIVPMAQAVPQMGMPLAEAVDESGLLAEAKMREAEARIRIAEQRAQQAEAAMRLQEAEMRMHAAEQALTYQARMAALEKALRDAMPGWLTAWTERSTATLQTAIAHAEAAAPPEGSSLQAALLEAKAALRSQQEAKARKEAEVRREAEERARREAEERALREAAARREAKAALRSQEEAKAQKEVDERARREAEERARREAEDKARRAVPMGDTDGRLLKAAADGNTRWALRLIEQQGANVNCRDPSSGDTPLLEACAIGHTDTVRMLVDKGADLHAKNRNGYTPLHEACGRGHIDTARLLVDKGADLHAKGGGGGGSAFWRACCRNHIDVARMLVDKGADLHEKDGAGRSLLSLLKTHGGATGPGQLQATDTVRFLEEALAKEMR
jgi:hypothetical protein